MRWSFGDCSPNNLEKSLRQRKENITEYLQNNQQVFSSSTLKGNCFTHPTTLPNDIAIIATSETLFSTNHFKNYGDQVSQQRHQFASATLLQHVENIVLNTRTKQFGTACHACCTSQRTLKDVGWAWKSSCVGSVKLYGTRFHILN